MKRFSMTLYALAGLLMVSGAAAMPIQYTLDNVVWDDGGTATGSFIFDPDVGWPYVSVLSIITTPGGTMGGASYTLQDFTSSGDVSFRLVTNVGDILVLSFEDSIGTVGVNSLIAGVGTTSDSRNGGLSRRNAVSGTVIGTAVPIPAAAWLFGSALGLLAWARRREGSS